MKPHPLLNAIENIRVYYNNNNNNDLLGKDIGTKNCIYKD